MRKMETLAAIHPIVTRKAVTSKEVVAAGADAERIKIEGTGKGLDRNLVIEVGAIRKGIWAVESIGIFPLSPLDLPN